jgi:hypothetical protein
MAKRIITSANIVLQDIGLVKFRRNLRAKRLTISIRPSTGVRVTIPGLLPFENAKKFVSDKKGWIVEKLKEIEESSGTLTNLSKYRTRDHTLKYYPENTNTFTIELKNSEIQVKHPINVEQNDPHLKFVTKKAIELGYRKEACDYLPGRVKILAEKHGFNYNVLKINCATSRWGSCSANNNINLSLYLMRLPNDLVDYIILHELTHTIHKNHGPNFWKHLDGLTGNAKALAQRVKKYRTVV